MEKPQVSLERAVIIMGRVTIIFLTICCFIGLMNCDPDLYPWKGYCGGHMPQHMDRAQKSVPWGTRGPTPGSPEDLRDKNQWLITVFAGNTRDTIIPVGSAALITATSNLNILTSDIAITSADVCTIIHQKKVAYAYCGVKSVSVSFRQVKIIDCWTHPEYNEKTGQKAVGVILLEKKIPITPPYQAVCLPEQEESDTWTNGTTVRVVSLCWENGKIENWRPQCVAESLLRQMNLAVTFPTACHRSEVYKSYKYLDGNAVFCVDAVDVKEDIGRSDLGAPIVTDGHGTNTATMVGIVDYARIRDQFEPTFVFRLSSVLYDGWVAATINHVSSIYKTRA